MEYRVLGPLEVRRRGRPIDVGGPKPRTLLALLVARSNRMVASERLIDELWGDLPPPTAAKALQTHVSFLRKALEPDRPPGDSPQVLVTEGQGYALRVDPNQVDALRFEGLAADGGEALRSGRTTDAAAAFRAALELWRGPAFGEFDDQDLLRAEGARLGELLLAAHERALEADLALGREAEVAAEAARLLQDHPLRERLWAHLMLASYRTGRQVEALRAYRRARRILGEELGIEPSAELRHLEEAILLHDPSLEAPKAPGPATPPRPLPFPPILATASSRDLVGRDGLVSRLDDVWDAVRDGQRRLVFLEGEPGIGKTSLAAVWCRRAHQSGATAVAGRGTEEASIPYLPFIEVVRQVLAQLGAAALRLPVVQAAQLARLAPDLVRLPAKRLRVEPGTEQYLLYEAVASLLQVLAAEQPLIVLLEDLHWADPPTIEMLAHLAGHHQPAPLLVLVTYRQTDLGRRHPLVRLRHDLAKDPACERIRLSGLNEDATNRLLATITGRAVPDEFARIVHAETSGNPFFVETIAAHLAESGAVDELTARWTRTELADLGVPERIKEAIRHRLNRLSGRSARALEAASVLGVEFDAGVLHQIGALTEDAVLDVLDEAQRAGLVDERLDPPARYRFSHALIRQAIYQDQSHARRRRFHRRAAEVLTAARAPAGELVHHWSAAGDRPKALAASVRAAEESLAVSAFSETARHLAGAMELWPQVDTPERHAGIDRPELLHRAADVEQLLGRYDRAVALGRHALAGVDPSEAPVRAGVLSERLAGYLYAAGHGGEALQAAEEATRLIPEHLPSTERARALATLSHLHQQAGRYAPARSLAVQTIDVARAAGDRQAEGRALCTLGAVEGLEGEVATGIAHLEESRRIAEDEAAVHDQLRSYTNLGVVLHQAGRAEDAMEAFLAGADLSSRYGLDSSFGWHQRANAATELFNLGRWKAAWALLADAPVNELQGTTAFMVVYRRGTILAAQGRFGRARRMVDELLVLVEDEPEYLGLAYDLAARIARWAGRPEVAWETLQRGMELLAERDDRPLREMLTASEVEVLADLAATAPEPDGFRERAAAMVASMREATGRSPAPTSNARLAQIEAELTRLDRRSDPAAWGRAVEAWEAISHPHPAAYCRWRQGEALAAVGCEEAAASVLGTAAEAADRLGARPLRERVEATAAALAAAVSAAR